MARQVDIRPALVETMEMLKTALQKELAEQGHRLTGSLEKSLQYVIKQTPTGYIALMSSNDYGLLIEFGVKPSRIPYSGRTGRGGKSKYIEGLISFWQKRGLPQREALSAAFATAAVHKREGMPTRASYKFSRTGERTNFVQTVVSENMEEIAKIIANEAGKQLQVNLADQIRLATIRIPI